VYAPSQFHWEVTRQRHAEMLREVRLCRLAAVIEAERNASPLRRLARTLWFGAVALLIRARSRVGGPVVERVA
jgi:hypothetical protein